jgi:hypothetical protein
MSMIRSLAAAAALAGATFALAACADDRGPTTPAAAESPALAMSSHAHMGAETGTTGGWMDGRTVTFFYNKPFFCQEPPASGATSDCELGAEPQVAPRGGPIPVLYVLVPLFEGVDPSTLQCPVAGSCINHPSTMDLSRVFGPGTENAALPPHSHVIGDEDRQTPNGGWWEIEVVGVPTAAAWNAIAAEKSLATVRRLQQAQAVTGDIPTNLYLFFGVRR